MPQQLPLFEGAESNFGLVGDSPEIQRVLRFIRKLKNNRSPVLLTGESGTGKELVARAIHTVSPVARGPFLAVNAASLTPTLVESELFGHTRGAFTGAVGPHRGLMEQAGGGTLFLDEIGELPLPIQTKLLRALEERQIRPVGSERPVAIDARVIAATNREPLEEIAQGRFRRDLYYRLNVLGLQLAPLRQRRQDIILLACHFLSRYATRPLAFSSQSIDALLRYDWPGNVRELDNAMQRMAALASGSELGLDALPTPIRNASEARGDAEPRPSAPAFDLKPLEDIEKMAIGHALEATRGDVAKAAKILGIGKTTLYRKMKEFGLELPRRVLA